MTFETKYDIGQKVYYPTTEFIDDRGTIKRVVDELTIDRIRAEAWDSVGNRVGTSVSYGFYGSDGYIEEYFLFPTEEEAWAEHERLEKCDEDYADQVAIWGD